MMVQGSLVDSPEGGMKGRAVGYMGAMHGLCIGCHEKKLKESPQDYARDFAECANCHRDMDGSLFQQMKPYVTSEANATE